jgi:RNA polymerase sigma-70 factor (sigma-E family)
MDVGRDDSVQLQSLAAPRADALAREEAVDLLFRDHYAPMLRLAYCLVADRAQAEDVVQEAFSSLYSRWGRLRDPNAAVGYVRTTVIRGSRAAVRRRIRDRQPLLLLIDPVPPSSEEAAVASDERARLAAAVRALPRRQREVLVCRYYLDLSVADTAALLGVTDGSVKRHAHRGIAALSAWEGETR